MVSYEVPKPPQGFFSRMKDSVRLAAAFVKGDRDTISDITSTTVFSPLQPIKPMIPEVRGRTWDYQPGVNIQFQPRGYDSGRIPFKTLRQFARNCELLRLGIQTVKDQISSFGWQIVPTEDSKLKADDALIKEMSSFFRKPDKVHTFDQWIRTMTEAYVVTDAISIYRAKDRIGRPYAFEIMDGATIKPLVDEDGRRPLPPDPAYQQVIKGAPRAMYDMNELLYMPRDILEHDPLYGYPIVEQIIITAQTAIERAKFQLAYFTEGSLPDSYAALPKEMTADQIKAFEERFNNMMKGNTAGRREVPFFPEGTTIASLKQPPLKDDFDEWLARIIAYALGISPTALIKQMNRSTSEADQQRNEEEGQSPKLQHFKNVIDELLPDFGQTDEEKKFIIANVEFKWRDNNEIDADKQSQIEDRALRNGSKTINEVKLARGEDPIEGGDVPMVLTSGGYVPLDSYDRNQAMQQQAIDAQPEPGADDDEEDDAEKSAYSRVRKAVRHKPIPFAGHSCSCNKKH